MSRAEAKPAVGSINWFDVTVPDASALRDFYREVVGWTSLDVDMGGYSDYCMNEPEGDRTIAGICHARGSNTRLPPQWLVYITVADLEASLERCVTLGGTVLTPIRPGGPQGRFCVIQDPAGAVAALYAANA